ncbi:zinc ABC transporter substrate-binding protein [Bacteroidales bacterium]|nr:zinc ABC transporter substrate-binding protein [Bacteroidales bacterium]
MYLKTIKYFIALSIGLVSCISNSPKSNKAIVSTTVLPLQYFIEKIADTLVDVNVLIPPGAAPVSYEPTADQMIKLSQSSLYFQIGLFGFEKAWTDKLSKQSNNLKLISLSEHITPIDAPHHHGHDHGHGHQCQTKDPHIWMSAQNAKLIAKVIASELSIQLPNHSDTFKHNLMVLLKEITAIDSTIKRNLSNERRQFMIYHPALTYFAHEYGLTQIPIELDGKEPTAHHLKTIVEQSKNNNSNIIFVQKQFDLKNAEVIAKEAKASIVEIDPLNMNWDKEMIRLSEILKTHVPEN